VADQVVVEEDHSRAMELQEDDDLDCPCREGKDGGLLLRVDASLVLELQPSWAGNIAPSPSPCPSLDFPFAFPLPTFCLLLHSKVSLTLTSTFQHFLYFGGLLIETLLTED